MLLTHPQKKTHTMINIIDNFYFFTSSLLLLSECLTSLLDQASYLFTFFFFWVQFPNSRYVSHLRLPNYPKYRIFFLFGVYFHIIILNYRIYYYFPREPKKRKYFLYLIFYFLFLDISISHFKVTCRASSTLKRVKPSFEAQAKKKYPLLKRPPNYKKRNPQSPRETKLH